MRPSLSLGELMGSKTDALKLVSSMTLFREVAARLNEWEPDPDYAAMAALAGEILRIAAGQGYAECSWTRGKIAAS